MITVGIVGVAVAGLLIGMSQTYVMLLVFLALMGLAGGGYHPAATPLISDSVEPERRSRALGFHLIGGSVSYFLAPIIAAGIAAAWGWRGSFLGLAVPSAAFGIVFYFFLRRRAGTGHTREAQAQFQQTLPAPGYKRRLLAYMIMTVCTGGVIISTVYLLPLYIHNFFGASEAVSGRWLSVVWAAGLWAGPIGGWLSERFGKIPVIMVMTVFLALCILVLRWTPYGWAMGAVFLLMGIGMYMRMPVAEAYVMSQTTPQNRSTIFGIFYFTMQEAGAVFTPIIGFLFDTVGYQNAFAISAAWVVVVTLVCAPFLWGKDE
jgi:predicted MFS family arabinose efflux permease